MKAIKWIGIIGFVLITVITAAILIEMFVLGTKSSKNGETLLTAFSGAFFAYVFVKIGEAFTRMSQREKLNLDTIVEMEYVLNDHLNRIAINIKLIDALKATVNARSQAVNFMKFKPIPHDKSRLQNLKNVDYINELFNYFVDIEKINDGLNIIQDFARQLVNGAVKQNISVTEAINIQMVFATNAQELEGMMDDSLKLLKAAEKDCEELIAKNQYVAETGNRWLRLSVPWFNTSYYDKKNLEKRLPEITKVVQKGRDEVTRSSVKKISKTLSRKRRK